VNINGQYIEIIIHIWNQDTSATLMCYLLHYVNTLSGYVDITYRSYCRTFSWCKITSYIVYPHIGRMLKPLSLPWSHSLITRYVVSPFQVKSQKFLLHLLTILRRFCAIRVLYITVIIIVMCYKVVQPSRLWILQIMVISREILVCISIYYIKTNTWLNVIFYKVMS